MKNWKKETLYFFTAIIFAVVMYRCDIFSDDVNKMYIGDCSIGSCLKQARMMYMEWSSRVIINFFIFFFTGGRKLLWAIAMGVCMYVLQKSLDALLIRKNNIIGNWLIAMFVSAFPYNDISSAGWIATTTTYFLPIAFSCAALIPIKKALHEERLRGWEYPMYMICTGIAANNEQCMAVLLGCYVIAIVYFALHKKFKGYVFFMFICNLASAVYTFLCPGNYVRKDLEIIDCFPTFGMMDLKDKIDVGYATAIRYLFLQTNVPVILVCIMFVVLIWSKYEKPLMRTVAVIPIAITLIMGPLCTVFSQVFKSFYLLKESLSPYGLFTPGNAGEILPFIEFAIGALALGSLIIEIFLLADTMECFLAAFVVIAAGIMSQIVLGFSPTIWASGSRTCAVMEFCIIVVGILCVDRNIAGLQDKGKNNLIVGCKTIYILSLLNLALQVFEITI